MILPLHHIEEEVGARTVAALPRDEANGQDDVSAVTGTIVPQNIHTVAQGTGPNASASNPTSNTSVLGIRSNSQVSMDGVGNAFNRRRLNAIHTGARRLCREYATASTTKNNEILSCPAEFDSHADTCGVGATARIIEYTGQTVEVSGFASSMNSIKNVPIVRAALAYDDPSTGETLILILNQMLYFGDDLPHVLLNPNQLRSNGIVVDDIPRHLSDKSSHSIKIEEERIEIPLLLKGIILYFNVRTPTVEEIENLPCIELTSSSEWDPHSSLFEDLEHDA
jgi:hypothetical protein